MQQNDSVIIETSNGSMKLERIKEGKIVNLGRYGKLDMGMLIGLQHGKTYEIQGNVLRLMNVEEVMRAFNTENVQEGANNQQIVDRDTVQQLSVDDIEAMKADGSLDIVEQVKQNNKQYELKTAYSKAKYDKRKTAKFVKSIRLIKPSALSLCQLYHVKSPEKIRSIRPDMLAQLVQASNASGQGKYLVVEDCAGVISLAMLERMNADARLVSLHVNDETYTPEAMGYAPYKNYLCTPFTSLKEQQPFEFTADHRQNAKLARYNRIAEARHLIANDQFEAIVIATKFDTLSVIKQLQDSLAPSFPLVIYHPHVEALLDSMKYLRESGCFVNVCLKSFRTREYQVYTNRVHPLNNMPSNVGYMMTAYRVLGDGEVERPSCHPFKPLEVPEKFKYVQEPTGNEPLVKKQKT